jgi:hypothetical protein
MRNSPIQPTVAPNIKMVAVQVMAKKAVPRSAATPRSPANSLTALTVEKMTIDEIVEAIPRQIKPSCGDESKLEEGLDLAG